MDREKLEFRYFFNAGLDKVTGICDGEGSDFFERNNDGELQYIGSLYGYYPDEIAEMSDDDFIEAVDKSFISKEEMEHYIEIGF